MANQGACWAGKCFTARDSSGNDIWQLDENGITNITDQVITVGLDAGTNRVGIKTGSPSQELDVNGSARIRGGLYQSTSEKTSAYTTTSSDYRIVCNSSAAFDLTLHNPTGVNRQTLVIKNKNTGTITLKAHNVDGQADRTLVQYESVTIFSDGTEWLIQ